MTQALQATTETRLERGRRVLSEIDGEAGERVVAKHDAAHRQSGR